MIRLTAKKYVGIACMAGLVFLGATGPTLAVVPEIKIDPTTGIATSHPDLVVALATIETKSETIQLAQMRWRRAPWHRS